MDILIIEDDYISAQVLSNAIIDFGYNILGPVAYYSEAIKIINETKPDLAIIDIELKGIRSGLDLAKTINQQFNFPFIFLTSNTNKNLYRQMIHTHPYAILIKPFNNDELFATIELSYFNYLTQGKKAVTNQQLNQFIYTKKGQSYIRIDLNHIVYIKSDNVYLDVITINKETYIIRMSLTKFILQLNQQFIQVHKSYIINTQFITKIESDMIYLNTKDLIPIGKKYKSNFFKKLHVL